MNINMSLMPPKVIMKEACLRAEGPFGLSKDLRPKRCPNILWRGESKKAKDCMKVEDGSVHCKRYVGCSMNNKLEFQRSFENHPF